MTLLQTQGSYVSNKLKDEILEKSDVPKACRKKVISYCSTWFTKWSGYNFAKELDAKVSQDVYWKERIVRLNGCLQLTHQRAWVDIVLRTEMYAWAVRMSRSVSAVLPDVRWGES